jgi:hypothetical protein
MSLSSRSSYPWRDPVLPLDVPRSIRASRSKLPLTAWRQSIEKLVRLKATSLLFRVTPDRPQLSLSLLVLFASLARSGCSTRSPEESDTETQSVRAGIINTCAISLLVWAGPCSCAAASNGDFGPLPSPFLAVFDSIEEAWEMSSGEPLHLGNKAEQLFWSAQDKVEDIDSSKHGDDDGWFPILAQIIILEWLMMQRWSWRYPVGWYIYRIPHTQQTEDDMHACACLLVYLDATLLLFSFQYQKKRCLTKMTKKMIRSKTLQYEPTKLETVQCAFKNDLYRI